MILLLEKHKFWSFHFELLQLRPVQTINAVNMGFARAMTQPSSDVNVITFLVSRMVFVRVSLPFLFLFFLSFHQIEFTRMWNIEGIAMSLSRENFLQFYVY